MSVVFYQPVKGSTNVDSSQGSSQLVEEIFMVEKPMPTAIMSVKEYEEALKKGMEQEKHQINDLELQKYLTALETSEFDSQFLYEHDRSALARVILENFMKFDPEAELDEKIKLWADKVLEIPKYLTGKYTSSYEHFKKIINDEAEGKKKLSRFLVHPMIYFGLLKPKK